MKICMVTYNFVNNGIAKVILSYSIELVRHGHSVTVLVGGPCEQDKVGEATACGIRIARLPDKKSDTLGYFKALANALNAERFDVCHVHGNSGMVFPELLIAKLSHSGIVACHCHSTGCEHPLLHRILKPFVPRLCDCMLACSGEAGKWLFGDADYTVLPNSFELCKFEYDVKARDSLRNAYGIDGKTYVLGNVARLNPEKNHAFLIDVFTAFHAEHPDSVLMIVGGGPGERDIRSLVDSSSVKNSIVLLGNVADPSKLYSVMDCFVFPSIHEGLGIVLIEAQLAGLDCYVSSNVPNEACVSNRFHTISLDFSAADWASEIAGSLTCSRDRSKCSFYEQKLERFDIRSSYRILQNVYESALAQRGRK